MAFGVSSTVVTACALVTGAWLTWVTVRLTVATFESTVPSFALNVKLSGPEYSAAGVNVRFGAVPLNVPCAGPATMLYVSASPSTSLAIRMIGAAVSSAVDTLWPVATGAWLTWATVRLTVATFESTVLSLALNVKLSIPEYSAAGVLFTFG